MLYALIGDGRMGRAIREQASTRGHECVAVYGSAEFRSGAPLDPAALASAEVAFEFTEPSAAPGNVGRLIDAGVAVVCGTTGWQPSAALLARSRAAPRAVVLAPNFSLGVQLFYRLVREAGRLLGDLGDYDPFVFEAHHRGKRDAPSGTATRLAETLRAAWADPRDIPIASVRAGGEPGSHLVGFDSLADKITLQHRARGRAGFALGAVRAAEWTAELRGLQEFDELVARFLLTGRPGQSTTEQS